MIRHRKKQPQVQKSLHCTAEEMSMPFRLIDYIVRRLRLMRLVFYTPTRRTRSLRATRVVQKVTVLKRNNSRQQIKFRIITALKKRKNVISDLM